MKLTIKTLQQQIFEVEVETSDTVKDLKEKIQAIKGDAFPVAGQKLIYSGKILENEKTIDEYKVDPTKFIVAMVTKPKPSQAAASSSKKEAKPATASPTSASKDTSSSGSTATTAPAATPVPSTPAQESAPPTATDSQAALVTNENYEETVQNIMAFGYPRDQVEAALAACFNNPDRAVDFLEGGEAMLEDIAAQQGTTPAAGTEGGTAVTPQRTPSAGNSMVRDMIQNNPQLQQMVEQVRQNPEILQMYMQQMSEQNPELLRFISENQSEFVNVINNSASNESAGNESGQPPRSQGGAPGNVIAVTAAERDEIEQLKAMGFQEHECIEAYIACNKNVELAVNFLLNM